MGSLKLFIVLALLTSCGGGRPSAPGLKKAGPGSDYGSGGGNTPSAGNANGNGTLGSEPGSDPLSASLFNKEPTVLPVRRLLNVEYLQALKDIVGDTPSVRPDMLVADKAGAVFDNNVDVQSMSTDRLQGYIAVASAAATDLLASNRATQVVTCAPATATPTCIDKFLATFGARVYRRSLDATEIAAYRTLFASEAKPLDGVHQVLRGLLASPNFIFMPELGKGIAKPGYVALTGREIATRLSILILGTVPSEALLEAAAKGTLDTPAGIESTARTMIASAEAKKVNRNFVRNWLGLDAVMNITSSGKPIPDEVKKGLSDLPEETLRIFDDFMKPGVKFMDVFVAPYSYLTPTLGSIYGMNVSGSWIKTDMTGAPRLGFLSNPSLLAISGTHTYPSITRGKFLRENILCQALPPIPPNIPSVKESVANSNASEREKLASHLANASCAACHNRMEVAGYGMERYNLVGAYAAMDSHGNALTGAGEMKISPVFTYTDIPQLAVKLRESIEAQTCVASKLTEQLLGRIPNVKGDEATIGIVRKALLEKDYIEAVIAFIKTEAFLYRKI